MATSQKLIQEKAFRLATTVGGSADSSTVIDNKITAEDLFPVALREAVIVEGFKRTFTLTIASGVATLPAGILIDQMWHAQIEAGNDTPTSFEERFGAYLAAPYSQLNYAAISGNQFAFRAAGGDAADYDGDIDLTVIALPDVPATITTAIDIPQSVADKTSEILAKIMRGK